MNGTGSDPGAARLSAGALLCVALGVVVFDAAGERFASITHFAAAFAFVAGVTGLSKNALGPLVASAGLLIVAAAGAQIGDDRVSATPVVTAALCVSALECFALSRRVAGVSSAPTVVIQSWFRRIWITIGSGTVVGLVVMLFDGFRLGSTPLAPFVAASVMAAGSVFLRRSLPKREP